MRICLTVFLALAFSSFKQTDEKLSPHQYIGLYRHLAVMEMHRTGIPASIKMAQGLLESASGNSRLAREGNNHFGIKCKKDWKGRTIYEDDDAPGECFRAYDSAYLSYIDHSEFLRANQRYAFLFEYGQKDYKSWAHGLKKAGYATNPKYPDLLIGIIERHELYKLDELSPEDLNRTGEPGPVITPEKKPSVDSGVIILNNIPATRVVEGDSIESVAKRNEMAAWQIRRYNDLNRDQPLQAGEIIYLKPKRRKGSAPYHVVQEGETMWSISQQYGIKVKHLYRKNHLDRKEGEQPAVGETLHLQKKSDKAPRKADTVEFVQRREAPPREATDSGKSPAIPHLIVPADTLPPDSMAKSIHTEVKTEEKSDPSEKILIHTVQSGETLFSIARKYGESVENIKELNGLKDYTISIGQQLIINGVATEKDSAETTERTYVHVVQSGETLYSIARKYNMEVKELMEINGLQSGELRIGQELRLNRSNTATTETVNESPAIHCVEAGDTLYSISRKYGVGVDRIRELNRLPGDHISIGQVLKLR